MEPTERTVESVMKIRKMMKDLAAELKRDVGVLTDPHARAIFEGAVRALENSLKAILDFEQKNLPELNRPKT
jgi:hypothetical protein